MSHTIRRIIFWSFVLIFCIATLLLSLQAAGYKLSLKYPFSLGRMLQKTGMLIVESNPQGAALSLDGKPLTKLSLPAFRKNETATPAKIGGLLPGKYQLTLELEGYWPIQKMVEIVPGQTTVIDQINLFRNELPWLLLASSEGNFSLSPDGRFILAGVDKAWKLVDTATQTETELQATASSSRFSWIDGGEKLLLGNTLFDLKKKQESSDFSSSIGEADALCYQSGQQKLFYAYAGNLNCLNTTDLSSEVITQSGEIQEVATGSDYLVIVATQDNQTKLKIISYAGQMLKSVDIPFSSYRLEIDRAGLVDLYDLDKQTLYIIDPAASGQPLLKSYSKVSSWQWLSPSLLLYATDFEIHLASPRDNSDQIVIRIAEKIQGAFKQESSNFIIYAAGDSLRALEMTGQNISLELFRAQGVKLFGFDQQEGVAYFFAKVGQQQGVYQMKVR